MAEPAKLAIRRDLQRPSAAQVKALEHAPTGWLVDALGRRGALPHWIRQLSEKAKFIGTALTVRTRPVDNLAPYAAALADALASGHVLAAGLDVFEDEPLRIDSPLVKMHNVILTPHISAGTRDAMRQKMAAIFANLGRFFAGGELENRVTFP